MLLLFDKVFVWETIWTAASGLVDCLVDADDNRVWKHASFTWEVVKVFVVDLNSWPDAIGKFEKALSQESRILQLNVELKLKICECYVKVSSEGAWLAWAQINLVPLDRAPPLARFATRDFLPSLSGTATTPPPWTHAFALSVQWLRRTREPQRVMSFCLICTFSSANIKQVRTKAKTSALMRVIWVHAS